MEAKQIVYVVHEYPVVTQTFVENEALAMEQLGHPILRYAVHRERGLKSDPSSVLSATPSLLSIKGLVAVFRTLYASVVRFPHIAALLLAEKPSPRDYAGQLFALAHAFVLSTHLYERKLTSPHLHAHFLGRCLDVVSYARILLGTTTTTSATAHAADASNQRMPTRFRIQVHQLDYVFCASESVANVLTESTDRQASAVIHCGITPQDSMDRAASPHLRLLTVARQVEKKGLDDCIAAAAILRNKGIDFEWRFIGDGPLANSLKTKSATLTAEGLVTWMGTRPSEVVYEQLTTWADAFVLPCRLSSTGDVDGIPVALMEAMTSKVAVISSKISGIPELITHNQTGLLIEPGNVEQLVAAITTIKDDAFRRQLTDLAKDFVDTNFNQLVEARRLSDVVLYS